MSGSPFLDSNVLLYLVSSDIRKRDVAEGLLVSRIVVSPQVVFECINVLLRKTRYTTVEAVGFVKSVLKTGYIAEEDDEVVERAMDIFQRYNFQPYDAKIVATAIHARCTTLYSEDMQHGMVVEGTLTIINPFR